MTRTASNATPDATLDELRETARSVLLTLAERGADLTDAERETINESIARSREIVRALDARVGGVLDEAQREPARGAR
jgi:hypothetical protein